MTTHVLLVRHVDDRKLRDTIVFRLEGETLSQEVLDYLDARQDVWDWIVIDLSYDPDGWVGEELAEEDEPE